MSKEIIDLLEKLKTSLEVIKIRAKARPHLNEKGDKPIWITAKNRLNDIDQALTLFKQPKCKTCGDKKVVQIECEACAKDISHPASECGGEKPCPDCQQPTAGEWTKIQREYIQEITSDYPHLYPPAIDRLEEACARLDRAEAINKELLKACEFAKAQIKKGSQKKALPILRAAIAKAVGE